MNDKYGEVIENVELALLQQRISRSKGYLFRIIHRYRHPGLGIDCGVGEEIAAAFALVGGQEYVIAISGAALLLFDYLAHYRLPQTAIQIVRGIEANSFYQRHGSNAFSRTQIATKVSLSEVRVYIERIRSALARALLEAGTSIDPRTILFSERTADSNRLAYRLKGSFEWLHVDYPGDKWESMR